MYGRDIKDKLFVTQFVYVYNDQRCTLLQKEGIYIYVYYGFIAISLYIL